MVKKVREHARLKGYGADTALWVCAYANNQHELADAIPEHAPTSETAFAKSINRSQGVLALPDAKGIYFTRAWCAFETAMALSADRDDFPYEVAAADPEDVNKVHVLVDGLGTGDADAEDKAKREKHFPPALRDRASKFDFEQAEASRKNDLVRIKADVRELPGGVAKVNATLRALYFVATFASLGTVDPGDARVKTGLQYVADSALRKLHFGSVGLSQAFVSALVRSLPGASLRELRLDYCELGPGGFVPIADALEKLGASCALHTVSLIANRLGDEDAQALARVICVTATVTRLDLSGNGLSDKSKSVVRQAWRHGSGGLRL